MLLLRKCEKMKLLNVLHDLIIKLSNIESGIANLVPKIIIHLMKYFFLLFDEIDYVSLLNIDSK